MTQKKINLPDLTYLTTSPEDDTWGITVTTIGKQTTPGSETYPPISHPTPYYFKPQKGRILQEYQLVYIVKGHGVFSSTSCPKTDIDEGTVLMLFPNEWHSYHPSEETGWTEYWLGFKGTHIDDRVKANYFSKERPIFKMGLNTEIANLYNEIVNLAKEEKSGYQQIISSIVLHILGIIYYTQRNNTYSNQDTIDKINEARNIMRKEIGHDPKATEIAKQIGIGYSLFRKSFKDYIGLSPAQCQISLRITYAKGLLRSTELTISDIGDKLGFESNSEFSAFFKKYTSMTPYHFRNKLLQE